MKTRWIKYCLLPFLFMLAIFNGCAKKTLPVISGRTAGPATPKTVDPNYKPDTIAGKDLFTARCGRCHGLPEINIYTIKKWDVILATMIPKARLTKEQGLDVTAYIKANCNE